MMTLCRACSTDFASLAAFDLHRVGGWDARRCLTAAEMREARRQDGAPLFAFSPDGRVFLVPTERERDRLAPLAF